MCDLLVWVPSWPFHSKQTLCLLIPEQLFLMMRYDEIALPATAFGSLGFPPQLNGNALQLR